MTAWPRLSPAENERLAQLFNIRDRRWTPQERRECEQLCNKVSGIDLRWIHPDGF